MRKRTNARRNGFTLMEVLAALAIAFVIILATTGLIHNVTRAGNTWRERGRASHARR